MNLLQITEAQNTGGHPFSLNDLATLQKAHFDLGNAMSALHNDNFPNVILSPLSITLSGSNFSNTAGYLIHAGEVYQYGANTSVAKSVAPGAKFAFQKITTAGANNPVSYQNGTPFQVHETRTMKLVHTDSTGPDIVEFAVFHLTFNGWIPIASPVWGSGITNPTGVTLVKWRTISTHTLLMHVEIGATAAAGTKSLNLPLPYLVKDDFRMLAAGISAGIDVNYVIRGVAGENKITFYLENSAGDIPAGGFNIWGTNFIIETTLSDTV